MKGDRPPDWMLGLAPAAIVLIFVAFYKLSQKVHNHTHADAYLLKLSYMTPPLCFAFSAAWMPF